MIVWGAADPHLRPPPPQGQMSRKHLPAKDRSGASRMQGRALRELTACPGAHDTAGPGKPHPERPKSGFRRGRGLRLGSGDVPSRDCSSASAGVGIRQQNKRGGRFCSQMGPARDEEAGSGTGPSSHEAVRPRGGCPVRLQKEGAQGVRRLCLGTCCGPGRLGRVFAV